MRNMFHITLVINVCCILHNLCVYEHVGNLRLDREIEEENISVENTNDERPRRVVRPNRDPSFDYSMDAPSDEEEDVSGDDDLPEVRSRHEQEKQEREKGEMNISCFMQTEDH